MKPYQAGFARAVRVGLIALAALAATAAGGQAYTVPLRPIVWDGVHSYDDGTPAIVGHYTVYYDTVSFWLPDSAGTRQWITPQEAQARGSRRVFITAPDTQCILIGLTPRTRYFIRATASDSINEGPFNVGQDGKDEQLDVYSGALRILILRRLQVSPGPDTLKILE